VFTSINITEGPNGTVIFSYDDKSHPPPSCPPTQPFTDVPTAAPTGATTSLASVLRSGTYGLAVSTFSLACMLICIFV
jgi:hypothetical protein